MWRKKWKTHKQSAEPNQSQRRWNEWQTLINSHVILCTSLDNANTRSKNIRIKLRFRLELWRVSAHQSTHSALHATCYMPYVMHMYVKTEGCMCLYFGDMPFLRSFISHECYTRYNDRFHFVLLCLLLASNVIRILFHLIHIGGIKHVSDTLTNRQCRG